MDGHLFVVEALVFSFLFVLNFYSAFTSCGSTFILCCKVGINGFCSDVLLVVVV